MLFVIGCQHTGYEVKSEVSAGLLGPDLYLRTVLRSQPQSITDIDSSVVAPFSCMTLTRTVCDHTLREGA